MIKFLRFDDQFINLMRAELIALNYLKESGQAEIEHSIEGVTRKFLFSCTKDKFAEFVVDFQGFLEGTERIFDIDWYKKELEDAKV